MSLSRRFIGGNVGINTTNPTSTLDVSGTARITTSITSGALYATNSTITNMVGTTISAGTILATTFTGGSMGLSGDLVIGGTLTTVNITTTNVVDTNITSSNINVTALATITNANITIGTVGTLINTNLVSSNTSSGTLNLSTGLTAGTILATTNLLATGSSNTLGNIFTTGGSVGIGTTSPATDNGSRLSIVGSAFDSSGILRLYPSTFGQRAVIGFHSGQTSGSHWTLGRQNASNEFALSLSTNTAGMYFFANGNVSCGPLTTTAVTTGMILATTSISSGALYATNSTVTNFVATSITTGTLKATSAQFTTLTAGSIRTSDISLNGNLVATGDITAFGSLSDRRLKTNIVDIGSESALNIVRSLRPVTFDWKSDIFNESKRGSCDVGFIAQEVEEIIPQAVAEYQEMNSGTFYKNIRHERLIPYLVGAIQKLENINKKLEQFIHLKFPNEYN